MKNNRRILERLLKLRKDNRVTASFFEGLAYFSDMLDNLSSRNIIQRFPSQKGHWEYRILKHEALDKIITRYKTQTYPSGNIDKVEATRLTGNAHAASKSKYPSVPLRVIKPGIKITKGNKSVDAYDICSEGLALYLPVNAKLEDWTLDGSICLVENQRFFWEAEKVFQADYYLYLQGNFSNTIAEWLALPKMRKNPCSYFGDYDPTGIKLFFRIKKRIQHCDFFIPDDFEELLERYGNKLDLTRQHRDFDKLLETDDPAILRIRKAFEKTGKTLHQEALLI